MTDRDGEYSISGGVFFSHVIQGQHITVVLPPQVTPAMAGLPAASPAFTGRSQDLDSVLRVLAPRHARGGATGHGTAADAAGAGPAVVTAVRGMGGIGKTELALQAARAALDRGWFAGGVLFVDMFGYDPGRRLTAAQAAAQFVRALGIPVEHIPVGAQELERLLRSALDAYATQGRSVLMVIDNVSDHTQVAPLLPAHPACRAIVTSRHSLGRRLGARLIDLDPLATGDAVDLLRRAIQVARPGDRRITDYPGDALQIAEACGGLPLALQIAAALLADNPRKLPAAMASDLHDQASRLTELSYDNDTLTAVFDLSYQQLPAGQARLFRLLSANPGPDISSASAAALAGLPEAEARQGLQALARAHLIEHGNSNERWRMHDLIRLFSAHYGDVHAGADQRPDGYARLLEHYLAATRATGAHLDPASADPASADFSAREQALAWLDAEYPNLTAATYAAAADPGHQAFARDLPAAMWRFLQWRRQFTNWVSLSQTALSAAQALHDQDGQAIALNHLGIALQGGRQFEEAIAVYEQALQTCRDISDRHREGGVLTNLGFALQEVRRFDEAITACQEAAQILRDTGDRHHESRALTNLGLALQEAGRLDEAITAHQQALQTCRDTGDRDGESIALNNLGLALREAGRFDEAITAHQQDLQLCRDSGDRFGESGARGNLGLALWEAGRFDEAITALQQDLQLCRDTGDRYGEGQTLGNLGIALRQAGRFDEAITACQDAVQIFRDTGDRQSEGEALGNLGIALRERGRFDEAITACQDAAQIFRDTGDRDNQEIAMSNVEAARRAQVAVGPDSTEQPICGPA
jgi:tetratricopeptide (TPR) repeat protein